jgi:hypothetical protein
MSAPAPAQSNLPQPAPASKVSITEYITVTGVLTLYCIGLGLAIHVRHSRNPSPERLIAPIEVLVGVTAFVWLLMVGFRNGTILWGITRAEYYRDYTSHQPPEWVERPARTFNNLLQAPVLFYVICLLMMITGELDEAQIMLAWVYVAMRVVHATIYLGWNYVPYRFASWLASCITLGVMWWRFVF